MPKIFFALFPISMLLCSIAHPSLTSEIEIPQHIQNAIMGSCRHLTSYPTRLQQSLLKAEEILHNKGHWLQDAITQHSVNIHAYFKDSELQHTADLFTLFEITDHIFNNRPQESFQLNIANIVCALTYVDALEKKFGLKVRFLLQERPTLHPIDALLAPSFGILAIPFSNDYLTPYSAHRHSSPKTILEDIIIPQLAHTFSTEIAGRSVQKVSSDQPFLQEYSQKLLTRLPPPNAKNLLWDTLILSYLAQNPPIWPNKLAYLPSVAIASIASMQPTQIPDEFIKRLDAFENAHTANRSQLIASTAYADDLTQACYDEWCPRESESAQITSPVLSPSSSLTPLSPLSPSCTSEQSDLAQSVTSSAFSCSWSSTATFYDDDGLTMQKFNHIVLQIAQSAHIESFFSSMTTTTSPQVSPPFTLSATLSNIPVCTLMVTTMGFNTLVVLPRPEALNAIKSLSDFMHFFLSLSLTTSAINSLAKGEIDWDTAESLNNLCGSILAQEIILLDTPCIRKSWEKLYANFTQKFAPSAQASSPIAIQEPSYLSLLRLGIIALSTLHRVKDLP